MSLSVLKNRFNEEVLKKVENSINVATLIYFNSLNSFWTVQMFHLLNQNSSAVSSSATRVFENEEYICMYCYKHQ